MCCCCMGAPSLLSFCARPMTACGATPRAGSTWRCCARPSAVSVLMKFSAGLCFTRPFPLFCWRPSPACGYWKCWPCGLATGCTVPIASNEISRVRCLWPSSAPARQGCSCWMNCSTIPIAVTASSAFLTMTLPRSISGSGVCPSAERSHRRCPGCVPWTFTRPFSPSPPWTTSTARRSCGSWRIGASKFPPCPARWS